MYKKYIKKLIKDNIIIHKLLSLLIALYLKLVYATSSWSVKCEIESMPRQLSGGAVFALWHNRLAFGMQIFRNYKNVFALASPHRDGKVITNIIKIMKYDVIEGSTNKNSTVAVRSILKLLKKNCTIVITPDGPRGPLYEINGNITRIAFKSNVPLIAVSCRASSYFQLNSWDKMIIPKPFSKIEVFISNPIKLSGNEIQDNRALQAQLMNLQNNMET